MIATVPIEYVKETCKPGKQDCCRYLVMGRSGFECAKHTEIRSLIDRRVAAKQFRAVGDNCDGYTQEMEKKNG